HLSRRRITFFRKYGPAARKLFENADDGSAGAFENSNYLAGETTVWLAMNTRLNAVAVHCHIKPPTVQKHIGTTLFFRK
ncbi:MAG: hypothetical protein COT18_10270, partial [Elusimicrobia bacterium CG08_land_8_20_14_0_20_59_10]